MDHFRPKGRLEDDKTHPGYWWLAFKVDNYRYTCTLCNSRTTDKHTCIVGGKQDQFPIWNDRKRAKKLGDDHNREDPKLLDPLIAADTVLLTWQSPEARRPPTDLTRTRMALNGDSLNRGIPSRSLQTPQCRKKIYNALKVLIREGDILFGKAATGKPFVRESLRRVVDDITRLISDDAEYSAAAKQYLSEFRTGDPKRKWLDTVPGSPNTPSTWMSTSKQIVSKLWSYCNILRDDGLSYPDYVEQLTYLMFLKMASETCGSRHSHPKGFDWSSLTGRPGRNARALRRRA